VIVDVKLRFLTPCLGNVRERECDRMIKDQDGNVIFMQSWWRGCLKYGAKALNHFFSEVDQVQASPIVTGTLSLFKRFYAPDKFTYHECFKAGEVITVSFCLPDRINPESFRELLEVGGRYVGVSPYGYRADFGRFTVLSVEPSCSHQIRKPDPGDAGNAGSAGTAADVPAEVSADRESERRRLRGSAALPHR
jgi:hypothetical protein